MRHYTTFLFTIFQGNRITFFLFMVTLTPLQNEEKTEETKPVLEVHISEMPGVICLKFGIWGTDGTPDGGVLNLGC